MTLAISRMLDWKANGLCVTLVTLDVSKAFNHLSFRKNLSNMREQGVKNSVIRIMADYFNNRLTEVKWRGQKSTRRPIKAGIGQGTLVAPLNFVQNMDTIAKKLEGVINEEERGWPENVKTRAFFYVDDIALMKAKVYAVNG